MISFRTLLRSAAALWAIMTVGVSLAEDGIARTSGSGASDSSDRVGIVRMRGPAKSGVRLASYSESGICGEQTCTPPGCVSNGFQQCGPCNASGYGNGCYSGYGAGGHGGTCYTPIDCNMYFSACDASGMPMSWCARCQSSPCQCRGGLGRGSAGCEDVYLFAGPVDSGTGSRCRDVWHGQSMSFRNKNARLANCLFGWMIPSGCCGQGCPPIGCYGITYADQPDYVDPRDTQQYAAHGYGMPMSVPLAPTVNYTYNYSAGLPASRVTQLGSYNPMTSPRPLYHQSW